MHLNPKDFPDSAYARVLREGRAGRQFEEPLEAEYQLSHLWRVRRRVRIFFSLIAILGLWFIVDHVRRIGLWSPSVLLRFGAVIPAMIAILGVAWSRHYARYYLPFVRVLVPLLGGLMAVFIAQDLADDRPELLASLSVNVIGLFFFTGLMFRQALLACATMLLAFVLAAYAIGLPEPVLVRCMVMLGLTAVIGAIIGADVDGSYRRSFLEAAVIQQLAASDGLTGLMNRRAFDDHLNQVWQHAIRDQRNVAILMIDIDFFKRYNDTHGHQAGDEALRRVARVIDGFAKRPLDLAARYGGEEFAVILYDLTESDVKDIAERLRLAVQHELIGQALDEAGRGTAGAMTVSVGAGIARPTIERTPASAIQLADEALYEAKEAGRNRIVVHGVAAYEMLHTGDFVLPSHVRSGRRESAP